MSDLAVVVQLMSGTVGLVGVLAAGLSVYFTYRGRHNQFRQVVYGKQMDAYFDIGEAMSNLYTAAESCLASTPRVLRNEDARTRLRTALRQEHEQFTGAVNRSLIVLPSKVKASVSQFNEVLLAISAPAEQQGASQDHAPEPGAELARAYTRAINCIRHHLAIDSLTTGLLEEMGIGSESVTLKGFRSGVHPLVPVGRRAP